jgi:hypothetical protein
MKSYDEITREANKRIDRTPFDELAHRGRQKRTTVDKNLSLSIEALEWVDKLIAINKKRKRPPYNRSSMISFLILQHKIRIIKKAKDKQTSVL